MDAQEVHQLTYGDEDQAEDLAAAGVRLPAARVLVFLARYADSTALEIGRGTGQTPSVVCLALHRLIEQGWVAGHGEEDDARMMKGYSVLPCMAIRCNRGIGPRTDR